MLVFPDRIKVEDVLATTSPEYDEKCLNVEEDLFHGISKKKAEEYLVKRAIELQSLRNEFKERCQRSSYTNYYASIIRNFADSTISDPPIITGSPKLEYLNETLTNVAHELLINAILHGHSWLRVNFDEELPKLEAICPVYVDDWSIKPTEEDPYIRFRHENNVRETIFTKPDGLKKTITYVTGDQTVIYSLIERDGDKPEYFDKESAESHELGALPYFQLKMPAGLHIGSLIKDHSITIFNIESDYNWQLAKQAFSILALFTDIQNLKDVIVSESNAIVLRKGEDAKFISPDASQAESHFNRIEQLRDEIYRVVNQSSYAAVGANANQSGKSKRMDYSTTQVVLRFLAEDTRRVLAEAVEMIASILSCPAGTVAGMIEFQLGDDEAEGDEPNGNGSKSKPAKPADANAVSR